MVGRSKDDFISGTYYFDLLQLAQTDLYAMTLLAGTTYYLPVEAESVQLNFALTGPLGVVSSATLSTAQQISYTPTITGFYALAVGTLNGAAGSYTMSGGDAWVSLTNTTTGRGVSNPFMQPYVDPVAGLTHQYVNITTDNLNISTATPNVFLRSGSGMDGLTVSTGNNILDGSTGSNFLIGGTGNDTF